MGNAFLKLCGRGSLEEKQDTLLDSLERTTMKRNTTLPADLSNTQSTSSKRPKTFQDTKNNVEYDLASGEGLHINSTSSKCTSSVSCYGGGDTSSEKYSSNNKIVEDSNSDKTTTKEFFANEIGYKTDSENVSKNFGSSESIHMKKDGHQMTNVVTDGLDNEANNRSLISNVASSKGDKNVVPNTTTNEIDDEGCSEHVLGNESCESGSNKVENVLSNEESFINSEDIYSINHINELPPNLLVHIFQYLNLYDTLHRVSLVCKLWHNLCCDPDIWRNIDLKGQMKVDDPLLLRLTSYSGNVMSLDLTDVRLTTNEGMVSTLKQCPQLRSLSLVRCMHLTDYAFQAIGEYCHQLVTLKLDCCSALTDQSLIKIGSGCTKLEKVWLNQCSSLTDRGCIELVQGCPKLQLLTMEQCRQLTDTFLGPLTDNCPRLKEIRFMSNSFTADGFQQLSKLKELENLEMTQLTALSDDNIMHIVKNCPNLYTLNVSLCTNITDKSVAFLAQKAKNIKSLYLVACKLTDNALFSLADHCHNIEKVDVGWCTEITDAGAIKISEKCHRLQYLGLMRCDRVTREACQRLVDRFPKINYSTMWLECERLLARARSAGYCTL